MRAKQWKQRHPHKVAEMKRRRRSLKSFLPHDFTPEDEARALNFWNGYCAVCGRPLNDLFGEHQQAMDHWIALSDPRPGNPGSVVTNMLPLCHGINGCNNKKGSLDPIEWLEREFGKHKSREILGRIEAYFEWAAEQKYG